MKILVNLPTNHRSTCMISKILLAADRDSSLNPHCVSLMDFTANVHTSMWKPCIRIVLNKLRVAVDSFSRCARDPMASASHFQSFLVTRWRLPSSLEKSANFVAPSASAKSRKRPRLLCIPWNENFSANFSILQTSNSPSGQHRPFRSSPPAP